MNSAPLCVSVVVVVVVVFLFFFFFIFFLLRPVCLLFVFSLPFLLPSLLQPSLEAVWLQRPPVALGEIVVSHHSRWYQWLWVTQLETLCVCVYVCVLWVLYICTYVHVCLLWLCCVCLWILMRKQERSDGCWSLMLKGQDEWSVSLSRTLHIYCTLHHSVLWHFSPCVWTQPTHVQQRTSWHNKHQWSTSEKSKDFFPETQIDIHLWYKGRHCGKVKTMQGM